MNKGFFSNGSATIINNGKIFVFTEVTKEKFMDLIKSNRNELEDAIIKTLDTDTQQKIDVNKSLDKLDSKLFDTKNGCLYLKGINLAIPKELAHKFLYLKGKELKALINFWYWCALNPIPQSREDLYKFIKNNGIQLTPSGNLVLYRSIVKKSNEDSYIKTVSDFYVKVKLWKKSPANYVIYKDYKDYGSPKQNYEPIIKHKDICRRKEWMYISTLEEAYKSLDKHESNKYTDAHTRSMDIRIGSVYKIEESEVDLNNQIDCSKGLHAASKKYNYGSFGDTKVVVLVNPSKVRSVPTSDTAKMRVSEMFIMCTETDYKPDLLLNYDVDYFKSSVENLKELIKENEEYIKDLSISDRRIYNVIDSCSIKSIGTILNTAKNVINKRVVQV